MPTICRKSSPRNLAYILSTKNSIILQMSLALHLLSLFKKSLVKQLLFLPTLMWVYRVAPFLYLKALFIMLFIRDFSKSCGMEVYRVEKSNVWMEVALWTPKWLKDDSKFVEFLSIHILLTPVWLVFILQYFSSPVFITVSILVNKVVNNFPA